MFIIKERYLEVPNFQNWTEGLYLVDAPCGTGKSYFVFHTLYPFAKENNKKLIVFSNRNALKRQQELQAEGTDIELITYQKLEYTKAWHAPDGRIVLKFPKRYLTKDDLQYFEN